MKRFSFHPVEKMMLIVVIISISVASFSLNQQNVVGNAQHKIIAEGGSPLVMKGQGPDIDQTPPFIEWLSPTPNNGQTISQNQVTLHASVDDELEFFSFFDFDFTLEEYYTMDDFDLAGIVDKSSYARYGTFNDGEFPNVVNGRYGLALLFDGNDTVNKTSCGELGLQEKSKFAISLWFKPSKLDNNPLPFLWQSSSTYGCFMGDPANFRHKYVCMETYNSNGDVTEWWAKDTELVENIWHHIVWNFDGEKSGGEELEIWVNGNKEEVITLINPWNPEYKLAMCWLNGPNPGMPTQIGSNRAGTRGVKGVIDEFITFTRPLSEEEILGLYSNDHLLLSKNFRNLEKGIYQYTSYATDRFGNTKIDPYRYFTYDDQT